MDALSCRTKITVRSMDELRSALVSGEFPTDGLDGFIDMNDGDRTVTLRGTVSGVGAAWRFLNARGVVENHGIAGNVCAVCHEPIRQGERKVDWLHAHSGDRECWTGDGATAQPAHLDSGVVQ